MTAIKYHLSENGPAICKAKVRDCPVKNSDGSPAQHFDSAAKAGEAFDEKMQKEHEVAKSTSKSSASKDGRSDRKNWPNLDRYRKLVGQKDSVFVHPQGKIAIFHFNGTKTILKDGAKASTSATLAQLEAGRGGWKMIKHPNVPLMTTKDYNSFSETKESSDAIDQTALKPSTRGRKKKEPTTDREKANYLADYPMDSHLSALDGDKLDLAQTPSKPNASKQFYNRAASILPLGKRSNPHKLMNDAPGEDGLRFWNYTDRKTGEEYAGHFEVWSDGDGHYKAVTTYGTMSAIGSETEFMHDQSRARMGEVWSMVGAFEAKENGGAIGEIPNKSIPVYTYK